MPSIGIGARVIWQNILFANFVALCIRFGPAFAVGASSSALQHRHALPVSSGLDGRPDGSSRQVDKTIS